MFDAPADAWYVWLGLSAVSLAVLGVATSLPTAPTPDAASAAETIDQVAVSDYDAAATHALHANRIRVETHRIGLRNAAGTAHATLASPVTPVAPGTATARLLRGRPPAAVFASPSAFERAVEHARERPPSWRPAATPLVVRRVSWGGVDVTLVGTLDSAPGTRANAERRDGRARTNATAVSQVGD